MQQKKYKEPIEFQTIQTAIEGDVDSINQILQYFQPYIKDQSKRKFINEFGQVQYVVDEYMRRRLETKLITKILDFKIQL